jgi:hypothetical protein
MADKVISRYSLPEARMQSPVVLCALILLFAQVQASLSPRKTDQLLGMPWMGLFALQMMTVVIPAISNPPAPIKIAIAVFAFVPTISFWFLFQRITLTCIGLNPD